MLGKLMKYELKATTRWFLPLYAALVVFAVLNRFLFQDPLIIESNSVTFRSIISGLSLVIYILLITGMMAVTLVVSIIRFYKSLLGDEGYLMFTLPVKTWLHIVSKLLISMLWYLLSGLFAILSIIILFPTPDMEQVRKALAELGLIFGKGGYITVPLLTLVSLAFSILQIYAAIALGQLFSKYKLLASFGIYIIINTFCQLVMTLALPGMGRIFAYTGNLQTVAPQVNTAILIFCALMTVLGTGCYILTNTLLKKNLNLE